MNRVFDFLLTEDGAVTVDWVVLCGAVVGIVITISIQMQKIDDNVPQMFDDAVSLALDGAG